MYWVWHLNCPGSWSSSPTTSLSVTWGSKSLQLPERVWFLLPEKENNNHTCLTSLPKWWWWTHNMMFVKILYKCECSPVSISDLPAVTVWYCLGTCPRIFLTTKHVKNQGFIISKYDQNDITLWGNDTCSRTSGARAHTLRLSSITFSSRCFSSMAGGLPSSLVVLT